MRNNLRYLGLLMLLLVSFSCKNEIKNKAFINQLSTIQNGLPSPYFNYYLYFKMDNGQILETNVDVIYQLYKDYDSKKNKKFNFYLENLIFQKDTIEINKINILKNKKYSPANISNVDTKIMEMDNRDIENKFLEKEGQDFILKTNVVNSTQARTILYKMFVDGYIISPNDLAGYYKIATYKSENFK